MGGTEDRSADATTSLSSMVAGPNAGATRSSLTSCSVVVRSGGEGAAGRGWLPQRQTSSVPAGFRLASETTSLDRRQHSARREAPAAATTVDRCCAQRPQCSPAALLWQRRQPSQLLVLASPWQLAPKLGGAPPLARISAPVTQRLTTARIDRDFSTAVVDEGRVAIPPRGIIGETSR